MTDLTTTSEPAAPARIDLTSEQRRTLIDHLANIAGGANLAITAISRNPDPHIGRVLNDLEKSLSAAFDLAIPTRPGDLRGYGELTPTDDDVETCGEAYALSGPGDDYDGEGIRAALELFAARLADRLPELGPAATCPHDDITGNRCEGCGAPVVERRVFSLSDLKTGDTTPAGDDLRDAIEAELTGWLHDDSERYVAGQIVKLINQRLAGRPTPAELTGGDPDPDCPRCGGSGDVPDGSEDGGGDYCHCVRFTASGPAPVADEAPF